MARAGLIFAKKGTNRYFRVILAPGLPPRAFSSTVNTSAPYGRPLITNIANSTELTACFLLACQLRTPLGVAYGVFCGAS